MTALIDGPCTREARRSLLRYLARNWDSTGAEARALALGINAHRSLLRAELLDVWDSYRGHLALHDGINGRPAATEAHWSDVNDELTGPDRTGMARDEIAMRVAADEDLLLRGKQDG